MEMCGPASQGTVGSTIYSHDSLILGKFKTLHFLDNIEYRDCVLQFVSKNLWLKCFASLSLIFLFLFFFF